MLIKKPRRRDQVVMGLKICRVFPSIVVLLLISCFSWDFGAAGDSISSSQPIKDPEYIVSSGGIYRLGFFSPVNTTNRYVGVWYNNNKVTMTIWVANRSKPLNDSSGVVTISEDGNLQVLNGNQEILWSSNVTNGVVNSSAVLGDDGNLVLQDSTNGKTIWESSQDPCDTFLRTMVLSSDRKTGERVQLTSWKSPSDPSVGRFSAGVDPASIPQVCTWKDNSPYWRSGPWNGQVFIGIPDMNSVYLSGFTLVDDGKGTVSLSYNYDNDSVLINIALNSEGKLEEKNWYSEKDGWEYSWGAPENDCDVYGNCGQFGICNSQNSPICSCLRGFEPKNAEEWNKGNWTSGCARRTMLKCERNQNGSEVGKEDEFFRLQTVKVPDFPQWYSAASSLQECQAGCLNNCSCTAVAYLDGFGCMMWSVSLIDIQEFSNGGTDLYIRLAYSEFDGRRIRRVVIIISAILSAIAVSICAFFSWRWVANHGGSNLISKRILLHDWDGASPTRFEEYFGHIVDQVKIRELPLFTQQQMATATDGFSESNKLGRGGFGSVYKGILPNSQEIAVKRLSKASGQGLEEFMNEVEVISKLQHRNLVRLLGCCTEGEEKMLVYEYMPNKSLDAFIFDQYKRQQLGWRKRFSIIEGIGRGLLYLHRDSRLKIIHRDLKASNVLLDQELNPKISDFGMARIFRGNEDQANTRRVVGTYGYMPPEYVIAGRFSEKSDVFSFGVLLLEIVSGRRNTNFNDNDQAFSLLGFAWNLWNEGNIAALVDPIVYDPCFQAEIFRCIHLGFLCVQELAKDRPPISVVLSMLNSEILDLPTPKKPAFSERDFGLDSRSSEENQKIGSINNVTLTVIDGR